MNKTVRIISNTVYGIGVVIVMSLIGITFFGSTQIINPDAVLPFTLREQAYMWLAFGTIPMLLALKPIN